MVSVAVQQIRPDIAAQQADVTGTQQRVTQAIQVASAKTGVNFAYLLNKAQQESGGDPNAKSSNSTASGLFQFTGQTWMKMIKSYGAHYGVGDYAEHIKVDHSGTAHVSDPTWRKAILSLRQDPQLSAEMAGELDKENGATLKANVGGKIGSTELYLAHFLGAGGASEFLNTMHDDPSAKAADILPQAAAANPTVFYNAEGEPRSVAQIYQHFARKFNSTPTTAPATMLASVTPSQSALPSAVQQSTASYMPTNAAASYAVPPYVVADAAAARSAYANSATGSSTNPDPTSLFTTMVLAQMKTDDAISATTPGTSAYNRKNSISTWGAIA